MPHAVSYIQDEKDPSVQHEFLINLGPLGIKEEEPDTSRSVFQEWSRAMMQHPPAAPMAATDAASLAWASPICSGAVQATRAPVTAFQSSHRVGSPPPLRAASSRKR